MKLEGVYWNYCVCLCVRLPMFLYVWFCLDIFWTAEPFVTKLNMVMHHQSVMQKYRIIFKVKITEGWYIPDMAVSTISS